QTIRRQRTDQVVRACTGLRSPRDDWFDQVDDIQLLVAECIIAQQNRRSVKIREGIVKSVMANAGVADQVRQLLFSQPGPGSAAPAGADISRAETVFNRDHNGSAAFKHGCGAGQDQLRSVIRLQESGEQDDIIFRAAVIPRRFYPAGARGAGPTAGGQYPLPRQLFFEWTEKLGYSRGNIASFASF